MNLLSLIIEDYTTRVGVRRLPDWKLVSKEISDPENILSLPTPRA